MLTPIKRLLARATPSEQAGKKTTARVRGDAGEALAEKHLLEHGLSVVERNFSCRYGEIDLIMRDSQSLVFVEVRYRKDSNFGGAIDSIHQRKQMRLIAAANAFVARLSTVPACRFDVVLIDGRDRVEWIRDAFQAQ